MNKPTPENTHKILVVTLSNLGDVILTLPVIQSLTTAFPKAQIHVMVALPSAIVFHNDPRVSKIIPYIKKAPLGEKVRMLMDVRRQRYDLIVDLKKSLIGILGGSKFRNRYFIGHKKIKQRTAHHLQHLRGICPVCHEESALKVSVDSQKQIFRMLEESGSYSPYRKTIVAAPGSKSDIKKWPPEYYAGLLERLSIDEDCQIVFAGDLQDTQASAQVIGKMKMPTINLTGKTAFAQLAALIKLASLVITNDSAPLHLADALRVPVLAIFGPTDPKKYGPRFHGSLAMRREIFCSPCQKAQCRQDHECMKELSVPAVYRAAVRILNDEIHQRDIRMLIIRLDRLGDCLLSLPSIAALRKRFPNAWLSVMNRRATAQIFDGHPLVDEVIVYEYEKGGRHRGLLGNFRFIREIIRRKFDVVFILNPSLRSYLVPFVAQIPYRIGFDPHLPWVLNKKIPDLRHEGKKHESEYTLDVIRAFGITETGLSGQGQPSWLVSKKEALEIDKMLEVRGVRPQDRVMAVHPHASCPSKRWPIDRFENLIERVLEKDPELKVALIGGSEAKKICEEIKNEVTADNVIDLSGCLSLRQLGAFLQRCQVLCSNDSGPVHVASAVCTKTVTIFGRNQEGLSFNRWRALGEGHTVLHKDVGCVSCTAHKCTIHFECLNAVTVTEVLKALEDALALQAVR